MTTQVQAGRVRSSAPVPAPPGQQSERQQGRPPEDEEVEPPGKQPGARAQSSHDRNVTPRCRSTSSAATNALKLRLLEERQPGEIRVGEVKTPERLASSSQPVTEEESRTWSHHRMTVDANVDTLDQPRQVGMRSTEIRHDLPAPSSPRYSSGGDDVSRSRRPPGRDDSRSTWSARDRFQPGGSRSRNRARDCRRARCPSTSG